MKNNKLEKLIKVSLLSAIALILMFIEFPIPFFPEFLKIDISDLPALIGGFALGPVHGVVIELLKNLLHGMIKTSTGFIGEFANFTVGSIMVLVSAYIYKRNKTRKNAVISMIIATLVMSFGASILNYFLILPLYEKVLGFPMAAIIGMGAKVNSNIKDLNSFVMWAILPFNLIKGFVVSVLTLAVYKSVSPILHGEKIASTKSLKNHN